jgi:hypothetical protein
MHSIVGRHRYEGCRNGNGKRTLAAAVGRGSVPDVLGLEHQAKLFSRACGPVMFVADSDTECLPGAVRHMSVPHWDAQVIGAEV